MKKKIYRNMLQNYLEEFVASLSGRRIVILGCRGVSAVIYCALCYMGYDIEYFLDSDSQYDKEHAGKKKFFGKPVFTCNQLLYEDINEVAVLNTYHYIDRIDDLLNNYGFEENKNFYNIHNCLKSKYCNTFDPLLGYSRMDDLQGIKIFGEESEFSLKIVTLGGSTTDYSYSDVKSWPEYLHEILENMGIRNVVYNGGICGYSSCQERDKFIRDIIGLVPDYVLNLTGVNDINWTLVDKKNPYYSNYFVNKMVKTICDNTYEHSNESNLCMGIGKQMSDYQNWYRNEKIIHGIANEFGIKFYSFLQPFIFEGNYEMSDFEKGWMKYFLQYGLNEHPAMEMIYSGYRLFYSGAKEMISDSVFCFDITNAFDESIGVYTDGVHCDESGNKILAECIIKVLKKAGEL